MKTKRPMAGSGTKPQSHTTQRNKSQSGSTPPTEVPGVREDEPERPRERKSHRDEEPYDEEGAGGSQRLDDIR